MNALLVFVPFFAIFRRERESGWRENANDMNSTLSRERVFPALSPSILVITYGSEAVCRRIRYSSFCRVIFCHVIY